MKSNLAVMKVKWENIIIKIYTSCIGTMLFIYSLEEIVCKEKPTFNKQMQPVAYSKNAFQLFYCFWKILYFIVLAFWRFKSALWKLYLDLAILETCRVFFFFSHNKNVFYYSINYLWKIHKLPKRLLCILLQ